MPKDAVFTMKLDAELRDAFMAEAVKEDRPASQILRELMRGYVEDRRQSEAYDDYFGQKVALARRSVSRGRAGRMPRSNPASRRRAATEP